MHARYEDMSELLAQFENKLTHALLIAVACDNVSSLYEEAVCSSDVGNLWKAMAVDMTI